MIFAFEGGRRFAGEFGCVRVEELCEVAKLVVTRPREVDGNV